MCFVVGKLVPYHWIDSCLRWRAECDWNGASRKAILNAAHAFSTLWSQCLRDEVHTWPKDYSAVGEGGQISLDIQETMATVYTRRKVKFSSPRAHPYPGIIIHLRNPMPTISWVRRHLQASRMFRPPELPQGSELSSTHFEDRPMGERGGLRRSKLCGSKLKEDEGLSELGWSPTWQPTKGCRAARARSGEAQPAERRRQNTSQIYCTRYLNI